MQMCDTDLVPFDAGTFGSRTTPFLAPELAKAAATARELLIDEAAKKWSVDRATVTAADGRRDRRGRAVDRLRRAHQGAEADRRGQRRRAACSRRAAWKARGTTVKKVNGRDVVTGRQVYTVRHDAPGDAARTRRSSRQHRRDAQERGRLARPGDARCHGRRRRQLHRRRRADRTSGEASGRRHSRGMAAARRTAERGDDLRLPAEISGRAGEHVRPGGAVCHRRCRVGGSLGRNGCSKRRTGSRTSPTLRSSRVRRSRSGSTAS